MRKTWKELAKKKKIFFLGILAFILISVLFTSSMFIYYNTDIPENELTRCETAEDCILVRCERGTMNKVVINKKYLDYWKNKNGEINISSDGSCMLEIQCFNDYCRGILGSVHE